MSVITTKSTMLSILKAPSVVPKGSIRKVHFQLPSDIKKIFRDFKNGCNVKDYENLVCTIRDSEMSDSDLSSLLLKAKNCTSLLNYDLRLFIQALILLKWTNRSEEVVTLYLEFMNDLVSAHPCHTKLVIDQLVKLFLNCEDSEWDDIVPNEELNKKFSNIHLILKNTVTIIPVAVEILLECLKHNFPYVNAPSHKQVSYVFNMLRIIQYQPELRLHLLLIIMDKLVLLDVQCPKEEILKYEENPDDLLFEMGITEIEKSKKPCMKHPVADTVDMIIAIICEFIKSESFNEGRLNLNKSIGLFQELLYISNTVMLPTQACHHVQFIMFYFCSLDASLANDFLKFLWRQASEVSVSPVLRQIAIAYLSSFLARANYLSLGHLKSYLTKLGDWIHNYISRNESTPNVQAEYKMHSVFYSVCQAMFYLIAFRHQDLVDSSIKLKFLQTLNLPKIIHCKLNPLKFCLHSIIENFAAVTRASQLAYCYSIIENNARASLPVVSSGGQIIINQLVDTYFPFDPCVLTRTGAYISPLYREYKSMLSHEVAKIGESKQRLHSGTEDEDDFIEEENLGNHASFFGNDFS